MYGVETWGEGDDILSSAAGGGLVYAVCTVQCRSMERCNNYLPHHVAVLRLGCIHSLCPEGVSYESVKFSLKIVARATGPRRQTGSPAKNPAKNNEKGDSFNLPQLLLVAVTPGVFKLVSFSYMFVLVWIQLAST